MTDQELILSKGLAVPRQLSEQVRTSVLRDGIKGDEGDCHFELNDLRSRLGTFVGKNDLTTNDTRNKDCFPVICACGDLIGASYYALVHNKHKDRDEVSYVVRFSNLLSRLYVDGRDFLYPCFQFWDRESPFFLEKQAKVLAKLYGPRIAEYFRKATSRKDPDYRVAVCDLATQDS